ncbi:MAG TPA: molybdate ABC transporter substrate-binding protein [Symbiobacteriaceae bacterium]|nr:molybdate ABC transporter substrate-binding protein [Symbiobacteriaceae bacterium]
MRWLTTAVLTAALLVLTACSTPPAANHQGSSKTEPLTVAAASDLQFAFTEMGKRFEEQTGQKVTFTFGSTGNLAKQIENGAPIDLFAAADVSFVDDLREKGMVIPETQQLYAVGRVVIAGSKAAGADVKRLEDLLDRKIKRVAIANPDHAPYGLAAKQALISAGIWEQLQSKLVLGENIRQTLQYIQTGNAEAGIIALSIAGVPEITYTLIDDKLHAPLNQALGVVARSPREKAARQFAALVLSKEGQAIMQKYGFQLPGR